MTTDMPRFSTTVIPWSSPEAGILKSIRFTVFVDEQKVPAELELDDIDPTAIHILAVDSDGKPCGTGRLFPDPANPAAAKIGRMAVLPQTRRTGCGSAILTALLDTARSQGFSQVILSAQDHAVPFYTRFGFETEGDMYLDANIPHFTMRKQL